MTINEISIQDSMKTILPSSAAEEKQTEQSGETFFDTLKGAMGEVNKLHQEADQAIQELSSGENRDIHNTMIALEKAGVSFQLMMQVRNKILSAYETVMRTSI